jgi:WhiB family transcriptional regulator, redox-sensing transcriptional regulator
VSRDDQFGVVGLLAEILRGVPRLPGALCRGRHSLFDIDEKNPAYRERIADEAAAVCFRCPVLAECGRWAAHPHARVRGVVAGRVV